MLDNLLRILDDAQFQMVTKNTADSVPKTIVAEYLKSIRAAIPRVVNSAQLTVPLVKEK